MQSIGRTVRKFFLNARFFIIAFIIFFYFVEFSTFPLNSKQQQPEEDAAITVMDTPIDHPTVTTDAPTAVSITNVRQPSSASPTTPTVKVKEQTSWKEEDIQTNIIESNLTLRLSQAVSTMTIQTILKSKKCFSLKADNETYALVEEQLTPSQFETTMITGYYELPSKHTSNEYKQWMRNFLLIETPIVIFLESSTVVDLVKAIRPYELYNMTYICNFPLTELDVYKRYGVKTWQSQHEIDVERVGHKTYLLYLIWLGKIEFLQFVSDKFNIFGSKYFFWKDIGSIRRPRPEYIKGFPNQARVRDVCGEALVVVLMGIQHLQQYCNAFSNYTDALPSAEEYRNHTTYNFEAKINRAFTVDGSHQCGTKEAIAAFRPAYEAITDLFIKSGTFAGKDQTNMIVTHLWKPKLLRLIWNPRKQWFYMSDLFRADCLEIPNRVTFPSCPK